jgi:hypothetical protein
MIIMALDTDYSEEWWLWEEISQQKIILKRFGIGSDREYPYEVE